VAGNAISGGLAKGVKVNERIVTFPKSPGEWGGKEVISRGTSFSQQQVHKEKLTGEENSREST